MIDYMNYRQARRLVDYVELIAEKKMKRQQSPAVSPSLFFTSTSEES